MFARNERPEKKLLNNRKLRWGYEPKKKKNSSISSGLDRPSHSVRSFSGEQPFEEGIIRSKNMKLSCVHCVAAPKTRISKFTQSKDKHLLGLILTSRGKQNKLNETCDGRAQSTLWSCSNNEIKVYDSFEEASQFTQSWHVETLY